MAKKYKYTKKPGHPVEDVPKVIADEIIEWISDGKTLREYCRQDGKPSWRGVYHWIEKDRDFAARFARARDMGFDAIAEETLHIADTQVLGEKVKITKCGNEKTIEDVLGHRQLQIETRLKLLAKWSPRKYGDKLEIDANVKHSKHADFEGLSDEEILVLAKKL